MLKLYQFYTLVGLTYLIFFILFSNIEQKVTFFKISFRVVKIIFGYRIMFDQKLVDPLLY